MRVLAARGFEDTVLLNIISFKGLLQLLTRAMVGCTQHQKSSESSIK